MIKPLPMTHKTKTVSNKEERELLGPFWWAVEREIIDRQHFMTYTELVDYQTKRVFTDPYAGLWKCESCASFNHPEWNVCKNCGANKIKTL